LPLTGRPFEKDHEIFKNVKCEDNPEGGLVFPKGSTTIVALARSLRRVTAEVRKIREQPAFFYDAVSPIVTLDSIDFGKVFKASGTEGGDDYINCPSRKNGIINLWKPGSGGESADSGFERRYLFEDVSRGGNGGPRKRHLAFGPMSPSA